MFFVISGFLITSSWMRTESISRFLTARALRIFPALIAVTSLLVFLVGPALTTLSIRDYFSHPWTLEYFRGAVSMYEVTRFTVLPGVFMELPPYVQTNGPLWTLQYEWSFYMLIMLLGVVGLLRVRYVAALLVCALILTWFRVGGDVTIHWTPVQFFPPFFLYFGLGTLVYLGRDYLPMRWSLFFLVIAVLALGSMYGGFDDTVFFLLLGYLVIFAGLNPQLLSLSRLTRSGDYSYGIYIWGWPVQQTVLHFIGKDAPIWLHLGLAYLLAFAMAFLSWHLLESRMLRLKRITGAGRLLDTPWVLTMPAATQASTKFLHSLGGLQTSQERQESALLRPAERRLRPDDA